MSNAEHIDDLQADKSHDPGCVTKCVGSAFKKHHGSYRKNGYDEHSINPEKCRRYTPSEGGVEEHGRPEKEQQLGARRGVMRTPRLPRREGGSWTFQGRNFKSANRPFVHMYHHLIPWEVMSETFTQRELLLFQSCRYNINSGINLIILPCYPRIGALIGMFSHPSDHPKYSKRLIELLVNVSLKIKGDDDRHLRKKQVASLKSSLERWSTAEWSALSEAGRSAAGAHVDTYRTRSAAAGAAAFLS